MATKRSIDVILDGTLPQESKEAYQKAWDGFLAYVGEKSMPTENDFLQYFDYLHEEKKQKASTIWCTYSKINAIYQREYNEKLQKYPRLTQVLKSYNATYQRKVASVFEKSELEEFLSLEVNSPFILVRKAVVCLAIAGGLRTSEVKILEVGDVVKEGNIYKVTLVRKKQNGEKKSSTFVVPPSLATHITNYLLALSATIGEPTGSFFKGTPIYKNTGGESRFVNQPMGINYLYAIGKDVAKTLNLKNPELYTGHCFRRTSATIAADSGATPQQMQRAFGWKNISTAQKYIEESSTGAIAMASIFSTVTLNESVAGPSTSAGSEKVINVSGQNHVFNFYC